MELLAEYAEYPVETGLLSKLLDEAKTMSASDKMMQLLKRRRQRQLRKGHVVRNMRRSIQIKSKSINKRAATLFKAARKRKRTSKIFRRRRK